MRVVLLAILASGLLAKEHWEQCAREIDGLHSARTRDGRMWTLYQDPPVTAYLAQVGRAAGVSVLPIYSSEKLAFLGPAQVFVTTGLLVNAASEGELVSIVRAQLRRKGRWKPQFASSCLAIGPQGVMSLAEIQARVSRDVAAYREMIRPRLKTRTVMSTLH